MEGGGAHIQSLGRVVKHVQQWRKTEKTAQLCNATHSSRAGRTAGMASPADPPATFVVEVKHGKDAMKIDVATDETVASLMETIQDRLGVLTKHQKLLAKGKVLEASKSIAAQACKGGEATPGGKVTVMLMASKGGGGGGAPAPPTAGQAALLASRAAKAAKLADARRASSRASETTTHDAKRRAAAATTASREAAWEKTGIVGLRDAALDAIPDEVCALRDAARVVDLHGNRVAAVPPSFAALTRLTRLRLSGNALTTRSIAWMEVCGALSSSLQVLAIDDNALTGELPGDIGALRGLRELSADGNEIDALPSAIGDLARLERLSVARNKLTALPGELSRCARLDAIDARRNRITAIPEALSECAMLRALALDDNRVPASGVPSALLSFAPRLCELSLRDNVVTMEELRELDGWGAYDARRRARAGKVLESGVMLGDKAFDEGADIVRFARH